MAVQFTDNSVEIMGLIDDACKAWLHEVGGEFEAQVKRNTKVGKVAGGQTKNAWRYMVTGSTKVTIGNTQQNALWEEFGTGEYALKGDGRKGSWFVHIGEGSNDISPEVVKAYKMHVYHGSDGQDFIKTKGKKAKRPLFLTFEKLKPKVQRALERKIKSALGGK